MNNCLECQKKCGFIIVNGYEVKNKPKKFCSHPCANRYHNKKRIVFIECKRCKKTIEKWNRKSKHKREFCSYKCSGTTTFYKLYGLSGELKPPRKYKQIRINGKYIYEHRHVMQEHLKRSLTRDEHVHHVNGNGLDNRIENLVLVSNSEHQKIEFLEKRKLLI